jgi:hypothetical protein
MTEQRTVSQWTNIPGTPLHRRGDQRSKVSSRIECELPFALSGFFQWVWPPPPVRAVCQRPPDGSQRQSRPRRCWAPDRDEFPRFDPPPLAEGVVQAAADAESSMAEHLHPVTVARSPMVQVFSFLRAGVVRVSRIGPRVNDSERSIEV